MSIRLIAIFILAMLLAVLAFRGPTSAAVPATVLSAVGLLAFLAAIITRGLRPPVI